jgi:hypothetical protein
MDNRDIYGALSDARNVVRKVQLTLPLGSDHWHILARVLNYLDAQKDSVDIPYCSCGEPADPDSYNGKLCRMCN